MSRKLKSPIELPITPDDSRWLVNWHRGTPSGKGRTAPMKLPFIVVFCHGEKFFFRYTPGREDELIACLIDYAMDERLSFGWPEVRSIMRHFGFLSAEDGDSSPGKDATSKSSP